MRKYDQNFSKYTTRQNCLSAQIVIDELLIALGEVKSVIDIGCGEGVWLSTWKKKGVVDVTGIDQFQWAEIESLIEESEYKCVDFESSLRHLTETKKYNYDICQCLEVAEHLTPEISESLVSFLTSLSDVIIFSSAPPGQGGEHHINEQPYWWWKQLFEKHGYELYDSVRPRLLKHHSVNSWYKYNTFIYVSSKSSSSNTVLLRDKLANHYQKGDSPPDISPFGYQVRKLIVRCLPVKVQNYIARIKYHGLIAILNQSNHFRR